MPRFPTPRWLKSRGVWVVCIDGQQITLGKDKAPAFVEYHRLMAAQYEPAALTVEQLVLAYWEWLKRSRSPHTCRQRKPRLETFGRIYGRLSVRDLRPYHVDDWFRVMRSRPVSPTTEFLEKWIICAMTKWGVKQGYYQNDPLVGVQKPTPRSREKFPKPRSWRVLLEAVPDLPLRELLAVHIACGMRAQEVVRLEARHVDVGPGYHRFVVPASEAKGRRHWRHIYIPDVVWPIVQRLANLYPEGLLFRNGRGTAWSCGNLGARLKRIAAKHPELAPLTMTGIRHTYAHDYLSEGGDPLFAAALMGHKDTRMIATTYGHLLQNPEVLQAAANKMSMRWSASPHSDGSQQGSA